MNRCPDCRSTQRWPRPLLYGRPCGSDYHVEPAEPKWWQRPWSPWIPLSGFVLSSLYLIFFQSSDLAAMWISGGLFIVGFDEVLRAKPPTDFVPTFAVSIVLALVALT